MFWKFEEAIKAKITKGLICFSCLILSIYIEVWKISFSTFLISFWMFVDKSNKCFQMLLTAVLTSLLEFPGIFIVCQSFNFSSLFQSIIQQLKQTKIWFQTHWTVVWIFNWCWFIILDHEKEMPIVFWPFYKLNKNISNFKILNYIQS